jgi:aspartate aminotransferase
MSNSLLSSRLNLIKPSATLAVNSRAIQLKAQGKDIISLGVGEPDFDTPDHIKTAANQAIQSGQTKYTLVDGTLALKDAIAQKFKRENGLTYGRDQITVGNGGKQVLYNAFMASLDEGDEVIIPAPYWTSYPEMVLMAGGTPVIVDCPGFTRFKMTPAQLEAAITPRTKWVLLNSPSNPTGVAYSKGELEALGEVLLAHPHVYVMTDDIYEHILYDEFEFSTIAQAVPALYERTLTINGVSKAYSMTGWRIGYAGGPAPLIKAMGVIQSQSTSNPCSISQAAAAAALQGDQSFLKEWVSIFKTRRDYVLKTLEAMPGVTCDTPEGAFYVFPDIQSFYGCKTPSGQLIDSDVTLATYLLEEGLIALVPGAAFGMPGHVRISYAASMDTLTQAMDRMAKSLAALRS